MWTWHVWHYAHIHVSSLLQSNFSICVRMTDVFVKVLVIYNPTLHISEKQIVKNNNLNRESGVISALTHLLSHTHTHVHTNLAPWNLQWHFFRLGVSVRFRDKNINRAFAKLCCCYYIVYINSVLALYLPLHTSLSWHVTTTSSTKHLEYYK